jgi:hypothetical protein
MSWWLKAVPWSMILANAPAVVEGARKLLDKRRSPGPPAADGGEAGVAERVAALESRERRMLELIESLASSNQQLIEAIDVLRRRARVAFGVSTVLAIGMIVALVGAYSA